MKIYHVETQEDYDDLMVKLEEQGYKWISGYKPTSKPQHWNTEKEDTVVYVNDGGDDLISRGSLKNNRIKPHAKEVIKHKAQGVERMEKVVVPQYVANWYEQHKRGNLYALLGVFSNEVMAGFGDIGEWAKECGYTNAQDTIAKMHLHGYEIEEEQKFLWRKKDVFDFEDQEQTYLNYNKSFRSFFFSFAGDLRMDGDRDYQTLFTESELRKMISPNDFDMLEKVWP